MLARLWRKHTRFLLASSILSNDKLLHEHEPFHFCKLCFESEPNPSVQRLDNHIPTQSLYYIYYYLKPKYVIIGYLDPLA